MFVRERIPMAAIKHILFVGAAAVIGGAAALLIGLQLSGGCTKPHCYVTDT
jgi:hypothetical protein